MEYVIFSMAKTKQKRSGKYQTDLHNYFHLLGNTEKQKLVFIALAIVYSAQPPYSTVHYNTVWINHCWKTNPQNIDYIEKDHKWSFSDII